jgi:prophage regulatory protein
MAHAILRLPQVRARTGLSRSSIYLALSRGEFPQRIGLGQRAVGWLESDIENWISARILKSAKADSAHAMVIESRS